MNDLERIAKAAGNEQVIVGDPETPYFVWDGHVARGPYTIDELAMEVSRNRVARNAAVWDSVSRTWTIAADVCRYVPIGLLQELASSRRATASRGGWRPGMHTGRVLAGVLSLLLPGTGLGQFVARRAGLGLLILAMVISGIWLSVDAALMFLRTAGLDLTVDDAIAMGRRYSSGIALASAGALIGFVHGIMILCKSDEQYWIEHERG